MGEYGDNPDPEEEKEERKKAEIKFLEMETKKEGKLETSLKKGKRTVSDNTYKNFYEEARNFNLNISKTPYEKGKLLIKYFPKRFGSNGKTPVHKMTPPKKGSAFRNMVKYSKKRIS